MMQLKKMNYYEQSGRYIKQIGNYVIEVFPSKEKDYFLRRVILRDRVIDVKKLKIEEIEKDSMFEEIIRNKAITVTQQPAIQQLPTDVIAKKNTMPPEVDLEKNNKAPLRLPTLDNTEDVTLTITDNQVYKKNDEFDITK
jgi:hypothetical protein